jgi:hemerythrin-like domain-containing protein
MKPTDTLKTEHKAIQTMLSILEKMCVQLETEKPVPAEHLEQSLDFFKGFADKCHHMKEEDLLFPAMNQIGFPKEMGPIAVMLHEHTSGRNFIKQMTDAVSNYKSGNSNASKNFISAGRNYISLLTEHIEKENNILFEMADMHLTDVQQNFLEKEFHRVEYEIIGANTHDKYHQLLDGLKNIYLQ